MERKQAHKGFERRRTKKERRDDDKSWMVVLLVVVWLIMKSSCKYFVTKMWAQDEFALLFNEQSAGLKPFNLSF